MGESFLRRSRLGKTAGVGWSKTRMGSHRPVTDCKSHNPDTPYESVASAVKVDGASGTSPHRMQSSSHLCHRWLQLVCRLQRRCLLAPYPTQPLHVCMAGCPPAAGQPSLEKSYRMFPYPKECACVFLSSSRSTGRATAAIPRITGAFDLSPPTPRTLFMRQLSTQWGHQRTHGHLDSSASMCRSLDILTLLLHQRARTGPSW